MRSGLRGPTKPSPFVGRAGELAELAGHLSTLRAGIGGVVLVVGEAGIGKTRLVEQAVAAHRGRLAWGTCVAGDGVPSFWPWRRVLRACATAEVVAAANSSWADARVLTEGTPDAPVPGGASRYRLFAAVTAVLAAAGRDGGLVVVLDDLHWADEGSVRLLQFAAAESRRLPVLFVCTYRDTELDEAHPLAAALHDLARCGPQLALEGLSAAELAVLCRSFGGERAPAEEQRLGATLHRQTGGNPFLAGEVLRLLPAGTEVTAAELSGLVRARGGVRAVVDRRLARLPQATYDVLAWAAIDGTVLDVDVLASATDRRRTDVLAALDTAVAARVVMLGEGGRLSFAHDLMRETLVASIALSERARRHWALGVARASTAGDDSELVTRTAAHLVAGAAAGDVEEAGRWAVRAAEAARAVLAYEGAAAWYERALQTRRMVAAADRTDTALLLALGAARLDAGQLPAARDAFLAAARLAREQGDAEQLAAAALGLGAGLGGFEVALFDQAQVQLLEEALAALGDEETPMRALVLSRLSVALAFVESSPPRVELAEQAIAIARATGHPEALASALAAWCDACSGPDHVHARLEAAREITSTSTAVGARNRPLELLGRRLRIVALLELGRLRDARAEIDRYAWVADGLRQPLYRWYVPLWRGALAMAAGDLGTAQRCTAEAERLGALAGSQNAAVLTIIQRWVRLRHERRFGEAAALMAELAAESPDIGAPEALEETLLVVKTTQGGMEAATAIADRMVRRDWSAPRADSEWLANTVLTAEAASVIGHRELARAVHEGLRPYAELFAVEGIGAAITGSVAHYLALTAELLGTGEAESFRQHAERAHHEAGMTTAPPAITEPARAGRKPRSAPTSASLRRAGPGWIVSYAGETAHLADSKGLRDLVVLLGAPGRPVHVTELTGAPRGTTDVDLDRKAIAAYRERLAELDAELSEAESDNDVARAARVQIERNTFIDELSRGLGLGGRARRSGDPVERARKAVGARIRDCIKHLGAAHPQLGRHLANAVRTGTWCSYEPEQPVDWRID